MLWRGSGASGTTHDDSEVMYFLGRQAPQPLALLRWYTKVLVNCVSSSADMRKGPTKLRRLDLLDLLLLDPTRQQYIGVVASAAFPHLRTAPDSSVWVGQEI